MPHLLLGNQMSVPSTLKTKWTRAIVGAAMLPVKEAKSAVVVVPNVL